MDSLLSQANHGFIPCVQAAVDTRARMKPRSRCRQRMPGRYTAARRAQDGCRIQM